MELRGKKIVTIIAHPDDETIGCGGFLSRAVALGAECKVVLPVIRGDIRGISNWSVLVTQLENACSILGVTPIVTEELVEDLTAEVNVHKIYSLIKDFVSWADIVLSHWGGDSHQAHRAIFRAVELATRPFRCQKTVLCFEILTSTDQSFNYTFSPNCFINLSDGDVEKKILAMSEYKTELEGGRLPVNLKNHMSLRGSQIGREFAEAFVLLRHFI